MAIEKSLYEAPEGVTVNVDDPEVDIALETGESEPTYITLEDGSVEIVFGDQAEGPRLVAFGDNLAEWMDESELNKLASDLMQDVDNDISSRQEWVETFIAGLDVLGFKYEERTEPWENACGAYSSVLAEAAIRFQAEAITETFPASGPVKTKILGEETREKLEAAQRVKADMNNELTEVMEEYRPEHERLLFGLGLMGSAFKKIYQDPILNRQTAVYVSAEDLIVPFGVSTLRSSPRITHVMRKTEHELETLQSKGFYLDIDLGEPLPWYSDLQEKKAEDEGFELNFDDRYALFEIQAYLNFDELLDGEGFNDSEDGLAKPYIVTIDRGTNKLVSIYRNWDEEDTEALPVSHFSQYTYVPGFGFYGLGLIHIIGGYARAGTSILRQLVDAGTLANLPGGFKSRGMRVKGDDGPINPGEFRDVDVDSGTLKDNIMPLPYGEPSPTLLTLLDRITAEARRLGAISDVNISDMSANAPVGTTLALLERTLKPMSAVQSRIHYSMKLEFKILKRLIAEHAPEEYGYVPHKGMVAARRSDYTLVEVIPVSDPNSSTMAQRVIQYQAAIDMSSKSPHIYNLPELHRQTLEVLGIKNADKIVPLPDDIKPADPVSENMAALVGKPMKAHIHQDHEAHITTHMAFMQDPMVAQLIGQNPMANQIMGSLQSHIAEHTAFLYRKMVEKKLGVSLPPPGEELPEEVEYHLAGLMADAGRQLSQEHQQAAAQQQAQQQAQDPAMQLEREKIDNQKAEVQRKAQKDMTDAQLRKAEQDRKNRSDLIDAELENKELMLEEAELLLKAQESQTKLQNDREKASRDVSLDLLKQIIGSNKKPGSEN